MINKIDYFNQRQGYWEENYNNSENLWYQGSYIDNKREGLWKWYFNSNKKIRTIAFYIEDKRHGLWEEYSLDGFIRKEGIFVNNQKKGIWIHRTEKRKIDTKKFYL